MSHTTIKLPPELRREFLAALQALRPGSVEEELTEAVCIRLLRDRLNPNARHVHSSGGTGRPGTGNADNASLGQAGVSENEWKLMERAKQLEEELRLALCAAEDIRALKAKASHLLDDIRRGKEEVAAQERRNAKLMKERVMLSDHTEKLMKMIRQLVIDKLKCEEKRKEERQLVYSLTQDNALKEKKIVSKRKAIAAMKEAVAQLNRQLQVMDDKFVGLRMRFDVAKQMQGTTVERAMAEAESLRKKFNMMTRGKVRLDDVPGPSEGAPVFAPNSITALHTGEQWMDVSQTQGYFPPSSNNQRDPARSHKRPATTGGTGRPKSTSAGGSSRHGGAGSGSGALNSHAPGHSHNKLPAATQDNIPAEDLDRIIAKIYNKQKVKDAGRWTPDKLRELMADGSGKTSCAIPDITSHLSPKKLEPVQSKACP